VPAPASPGRVHRLLWVAFLQPGKIMSKPASGSDVRSASPTSRGSYRSKVDGVWGLLMLSCGAALLAGATHAAPDSMLGKGVVQLAVTVATLFVLLAVPCRYTLEEHALRIQSGLLIRTIDYADIFSAAPERSDRWAPALSRDRLVLQCRRGAIRISPVRASEFVAVLQRHLQRTG
jgi:hypothetical protein